MTTCAGRPGLFVTGADPDDPARDIQFQKLVYGDSPGNGLSDARRAALNLRGGIYEHRDPAGVRVNVGRNPESGAEEAFDFKGNLLRSNFTLAADYKSLPDWAAGAALENEVFESATRFDALDRPIQIVAPHSDRPGVRLSVIRPGYNEAGLLDRVYLWLGKEDEPATLLAPGTASRHLVADIGYDAKGQRERIRYGNGITTRYDRDPLTLRLTRLVTDRGGAFPDDQPQPPDPPRGGIQNLSYFYDPVGNITGIRDDAQQTIFFSGQRVEPSADYDYDALYRLVAATGREHIGQQASPQVDHDDSPRMNRPLPNRKRGDAQLCRALRLRRSRQHHADDPPGRRNGSWTRRYAYEATSNRLRATSLPGDAETEFSGGYSYDAHGNMTEMPHLPLMLWDFRDQLQASSRQVAAADTPETTWYVYDGSGQRVRKITERAAAAGNEPRRKNERIYLGDFENLSREYVGDSAIVVLERETLHAQDDERRIALIETKTVDAAAPLASPVPLVRYQLGNHLGSASLELDDDGQVISYEEFHPYGSTSYQGGRNAAEVSLKRYRYTGMERDEENGLNYHHRRYLSVALGLWVSSDPIGISDGLNTYRYSGSNPISYIDPNGTDRVCPTSACHSASRDEIKFTQPDTLSFAPGKLTTDQRAKLNEALRPDTGGTPTEYEVFLWKGYTANQRDLSKHKVLKLFKVSPVLAHEGQGGRYDLGLLVGYDLNYSDEYGDRYNFLVDRDGTDISHSSTTVNGVAESTTPPWEYISLARLAGKFAVGGARKLAGAFSNRSVGQGFTSLSGSTLATSLVNNEANLAQRSSQLGDEIANVGQASQVASPTISKAFIKPGPRSAAPNDPVVAAAQNAIPQLKQNPGAVGSAAHGAWGAAPRGADAQTSHTVTELVTQSTSRATPSLSTLRKKTLQAAGYAQELPAHLAGETVAVDTILLMVRKGEYHSGAIDWLARAGRRNGLW